MENISRTKVAELLQSKDYERMVNVKGWARSHRGSGKISFIALNDGSVIHTIQIVVERDNFDPELLKGITNGAGISVNGKLVESKGKGQSAEIIATEIELYGKVDQETYPLQKKVHSMEFLRSIAHLRMRTNTFGAVFRIRHAMSYAIHEFFNAKGFTYWHSPIITGSDAEGAGEMFQVSTLDMKNPPLNEGGEIDYSQDFFGKMTNLTVSGQLEGELAALALGEIYTFGPTFRAENSNTSRHLAEFWMIEPEMAFYDIHDNMDLAEEMLQYLIKYALDNCKSDLEFLEKQPIENIWMVDATDVELKNDPWNEIIPGKITAGHEPNRLPSYWMNANAQDLVQVFPRLGQIINQHRGQTILNAGIIGGQLPAITEFLIDVKILIDAAKTCRTYRPSRIKDMAILNFLARTNKYSRRVHYGSTVASKFRAFEHDTTAAWRHK